MSTSTTMNEIKREIILVLGRARGAPLADILVLEGIADLENRLLQTAAPLSPQLGVRRGGTAPGAVSFGEVMQTLQRAWVPGEIGDAVDRLTAKLYRMAGGDAFAGDSSGELAAPDSRRRRGLDGVERALRGMVRDLLAHVPDGDPCHGLTLIDEAQAALEVFRGLSPESGWSSWAEAELDAAAQALRSRLATPALT